MFTIINGTEKQQSYATSTVNQIILDKNERICTDKNAIEKANLKLTDGTLTQESFDKRIARRSDLINTTQDEIDFINSLTLDSVKLLNNRDEFIYVNGTSGLNRMRVMKSVWAIN